MAAIESQHDEQRFVILETKLAYQEKTLADLNDVIVEQANEIRELRRRLEGLERFAKEHLGAPSLPSEKPPHY
jgi:SlyX protein